MRQQLPPWKLMPAVLPRLSHRPCGLQPMRHPPLCLAHHPHGQQTRLWAQRPPFCKPTRQPFCQRREHCFVFEALGFPSPSRDLRAPPSKTTNCFSYFSASTKIYNSGQTLALSALFESCSPHGGRGSAVHSSLEQCARFCRRFCSVPSHPAVCPPKVPSANRPIPSRTGSGAGMGPDPAPRPKGSPGVLPARPSAVPRRSNVLLHPFHLTFHESTESRRKH